MDIVSVIIAILTLTAGIGVFLVACTMMSSNLESASSKRLKSLFSKTGNNKWIGVGIGTIGTAAIQSSGAVTVMVLGFVNVGIMSLAQAATIIYGTNIGTTVTAQLVALGMFGKNSISTTIIFASFAGVGTFISLFAKHEKGKQTGGILTGFGLLFVGLGMMASAMDEFAALDSVKVFLAGISNPILLVVIGAVLTAVIQSSSVMTSIAITMVVTGLINLSQGIYITMGSNIGSCVVAIIACITSGTNAKRTAFIHLTFNVMGVVLFLFWACALWLFSSGKVSYGTIFESLFPSAPQLQLAMFHTAFNISTMLVALPLTNAIVRLSCLAIKDKKAETSDLQQEPQLYFLDEQMLRTPVVAVRQLKEEIMNMASFAMDNFRRSIHIVTTMDYSDLKKFRNTELELNFLNKELVKYAVALLNNQLNKFDHQFLSSSILSVSDLERIGDYSENIVEYADSLKQQDSTFSEDAIKEILHLQDLVCSLYGEIMHAYKSIDLVALDRGYQIEEEVDTFTKVMEQKHIERLSSGVCNPQVGAEYISLAQNSERIADHLINVGNTVKDLARLL